MKLIRELMKELPIGKINRLINDYPILDVEEAQISQEYSWYSSIKQT
jgi:hypothetical protein